jgi:hypothetical protein
MNKTLGAFVYAIVGLIACSVGAFYAGASPVVGGAVGAVVGAGGYLLANRKK